jgi:hypothetical protein
LAQLISDIEGLKKKNLRKELMPDKHYLRSTGNAVAEHAISEH